MKKETVKAIQGKKREQGELPQIPAGKVFKSKKDYDRKKEKRDMRRQEEPDIIKTPGIKEYPLTLECEKLYAQAQVLEDIPEPVRSSMYP